MARRISSLTILSIVLVCAACAQIFHYNYLIKKVLPTRTRTAALHGAWSQSNYAQPAEAKKLLNPFRDIQLTLNKQHSKDNATESKQVVGTGANDNDNTPYSSHHCVYAKESEPEREDVRFATRSCKFSNLFYNPQDETFHYYPAPSEQVLLKSDEDVQTLLNRMTVSLGNIMAQDAHNKNKIPKTTTWKPVVHKNDPVPEKYSVISSPSNLVFLLFHPFYSFNLGHLLWDDMLSLFSMLDIFGLAGLHEGDPDVFPMPFYMEAVNDPYYRCDVRRAAGDPTFQNRWNMCSKLYHRTYPSFFRYETHRSGDILRTGNWLKGMSTVNGGVTPKNATGVDASNATAAAAQIVEKDWNQMLPDTSLVLVPIALAGTGRLGQMSCGGDCGIGRASQWFSFREFFMKNILDGTNEFHNIQKRAPDGFITFSLPGGSSRLHEVSFFDNIIPVAKELYGEDKVKVVDMANLTMQEETVLAANTAILFANHGGGSATSIFLPRDAGVFLYTAGKCKTDIWCDEGNNMFDSVFYQSNGYMRPTWIRENERNDVARIKFLLQTEYRKTKDAWEMTNVYK